MLDPRIYRAGLVAVALAVIVFAFSFQDQPGAATATLVPNAFNSQYAYSETNTIASHFPDRRPGSAGDDALATYVARTFRDDGKDGALTVSTDTYSARTAVGTRTLQNVIATRTGSENGSIVIVAPRDSLSPGSPAAASGTAMLLSLANVLTGETLNHTIVLASISGSAGQAGAERLVHSLTGPIDAVIVLGDMGSPHVRRPVVIPWSNGVGIAPMMLRNTLAGEISSQTTIVKAGGTSVASQFVHLAFPLTITDQGPFNASGIPSVEVSASGERGPSASGPVSQNQMAGLGQGVLASISALDSTSAVPAPSAYMLFDGKVIPPWAIRLFVLVLIVPVLFAAVDGLARANRRRYPLADSAMEVVAMTVPFVLVALVVLGANVVGLLPVVPPDPTGPGAIPIHAANWVLIGLLAALLAGSFALIRWLGYGRLPAADPDSAEPLGGAPVVPAVMCVIAIAIWVVNPLAAALLIPALHLWLWLSDPELRLHPAAAVALLLVGLAPMALVLTYYAISLNYGPGALLWELILMLAGGHIGVVAAFEWCIALGCTACMVLAALAARRAPARSQAPVTVRGPVTYAGPGSLGGTESAMRR